MHKFTYENNYPDQLPVTVEFTIPSDASLDDMCQEFTNYLKAVGFHIPEGKALDFVPEDGYTKQGWDDFFDKKNTVSEPFGWNSPYNVKVTYNEHE